MSLYQVSSNYSPVDKFDPTPGSQILHGIMLGKL